MDRPGCAIVSEAQWVDGLHALYCTTENEDPGDGRGRYVPSERFDPVMHGRRVALWRTVLAIILSEEGAQTTRTRAPSHGADFRYVCHLADFDPQYVIRLTGLRDTFGIEHITLGKQNG